MSENAAKSLDQNQASSKDYEKSGQATVHDSTREVLEKEYQVDTRDITNSESLTYVILDLTVNQLYDRAVRECRTYLEYKSDYPTYRQRTERLRQPVEKIKTLRATSPKRGPSTCVVCSLPVAPPLRP